MTKYMPFVYDESKFLTNQKCFIITGGCMAYLTAFFNSSIFNQSICKSLNHNELRVKR